MTYSSAGLQRAMEKPWHQELSCHPSFLVNGNEHFTFCRLLVQSAVHKDDVTVKEQK